MGRISGIGVGSSGTAPGDGIRRRRRHGGGNPRDTPPHFPAQRSQGGRMLSSDPRNSSKGHDQPQAQAFLLRSFILFAAAQSLRSARFLLQPRELVRLVGGSSSQEKQMTIAARATVQPTTKLVAIKPPPGAYDSNERDKTQRDINDMMVFHIAMAPCGSAVLEQQTAYTAAGSILPVDGVRSISDAILPVTGEWLVLWHSFGILS
ncbi:hypothetical protein ZIOFF_005470 [Zingiber officinale]|uniref:Uncharacterized protein n=1 Tax=Zingiber officinale TaxID=94328 RepID=A0A8J5HVL4_ZINOF|nr:hypothetical protein ZIOFF_005470 [Zingiber officinale]